MLMIRFKANVRPEAKRKARQYLKEYGIVDQYGLDLIQTYADAYTTELDSQDIVDRDGLTFMDRFNQIKSHPLCSVIRDARAQKLAALKALNIDLEPQHEAPGRPAGS